MQLHEYTALQTTFLIHQLSLLSHDQFDQNYSNLERGWYQLALYLGQDQKTSLRCQTKEFFQLFLVIFVHCCTLAFAGFLLLLMLRLSSARTIDRAVLNCEDVTPCALAAYPATHTDTCWRHRTRHIVLAFSLQRAKQVLSSSSARWQARQNFPLLRSRCLSWPHNILTSFWKRAVDQSNRCATCAESRNSDVARKVHEYTTYENPAGEHNKCWFTLWSPCERVSHLAILFSVLTRMSESISLFAMTSQIRSNHLANRLLRLIATVNTSSSQ